VFYMGLARLDHIIHELLEHGAAPTRPAAIVAQGTLPDQEVIVATLGRCWMRYPLRTRIARAPVVEKSSRYGRNLPGSARRPVRTCRNQHRRSGPSVRASDNGRFSGTPMRAKPHPSR